MIQCGGKGKSGAGGGGGCRGQPAEGEEKETHSPVPRSASSLTWIVSFHFLHSCRIRYEHPCRTRGNQGTARLKCRTGSAAEPDSHSDLYSKVFIMWRTIQKLGMLRNKDVDNELQQTEQLGY